MKKVMTILYVADQKRSRDFYRAILDKEPLLDVPGMTEFPLCEGATLGLMPDQGTVSFLGKNLPPAESGRGIPRCELYLFVDDPEKCYGSLIEAKGKPVSEPQKRPWGDVVAYGADPDGHVLAFAKSSSAQ